MHCLLCIVYTVYCVCATLAIFFLWAAYCVVCIVWYVSFNAYYVPLVLYVVCTRDWCKCDIYCVYCVVCDFTNGAVLGRVCVVCNNYTVHTTRAYT